MDSASVCVEFDVVSKGGRISIAEKVQTLDGQVIGEGLACNNIEHGGWIGDGSDRGTDTEILRRAKLSILAESSDLASLV